MRKLLCLCFIILVGHGLIPQVVQAATQRVAIVLSGRYCLFHTYDVAEALKRVPGVVGVDCARGVSPSDAPTAPAGYNAGTPPDFQASPPPLPP